MPHFYICDMSGSADRVDTISPAHAIQGLYFYLVGLHVLFYLQMKHIHQQYFQLIWVHSKSIKSSVHVVSNKPEIQYD